jgi:dGTPase
VAQIAAGIARSINKQLADVSDLALIDVDLVQFAALAHDLGHPPFGHNGEAALDEVMLQYGGFEGNAQSLHILTSVERRQVTGQAGQPSTSFGLDLTARTLASVLKYDRAIPTKRRKNSKVLKGYYSSEREIVRRVKESVAPGRSGAIKTIECAIMDVADDIAYSTYDLEDSLHAHFLTPSELLRGLLMNKAVSASVLKQTNETLQKTRHSRVSKADLLEHASTALAFTVLPSPTSGTPVSRTLNAAMQGVAAYQRDRRLVEDGPQRSRFTAERVGRLLDGVEFAFNRKMPSLSTVRLGRNALLEVEIVKHLNYEMVIRSPRLAIPERRGKAIVAKLFRELVASKGTLLPSDWAARYNESTSAQQRMRVVCDFVAGMTDRYAVEVHDALFGAGKTIFKPM